MDIFVFILLALLLILIFSMIISVATYGLPSTEKVSIFTLSLLIIIFFSVSAFINYKYQKMLNEKLDSINEYWRVNNEFIDKYTEKLDVCKELLNHRVERGNHRK